MGKDGGWVFISHSHLDVGIVRKIRNQLEEHGFEPLLFFLKCLSDEDEIESLIKREIDEREWFVYVESENSVKSKWVRSEREYIAQLSGKKIFTVNIKGDIEEQVNRIIRQVKIYISFSMYDREIAQLIKDALIKKDFLVFDPLRELTGFDFIEKNVKAIQETAREGFVLLLMSEHTEKSVFVWKEINAAIAAGGKIIPVFIEGADESERKPQFFELAGANLSRDPTPEQIDALIDLIEKNIVCLRTDGKD